MSDTVPVTFTFADWPPPLSDAQRERLTKLATTYALAHGLLYLPVNTSPATTTSSAPTSAIHAPLSLFPSPIPRKLFERAQAIQHRYNILYSRVASDEDFLDRVMGSVQGVGRVDEFVDRLWRGWKQLRDEPGGLVQVRPVACACASELLRRNGS